MFSPKVMMLNQWQVFFFNLKAQQVFIKVVWCFGKDSNLERGYFQDHFLISLMGISSAYSFFLTASVPQKENDIFITFHGSTMFV